MIGRMACNFIGGVIMAKANEDLNLGNSEEAPAEEKKGGMMKIIIIAVASLAIGGGAAFFLMGSDSEPVEGEEAAEEAKAEEVVEERDPIYHEVVKDFVITFEDTSGIRYLQLSLQVMSYEQEVIDKVEVNLPAVRNSLIMLVGNQNYSDLKTNEGKENLRQEMLKSIRTATNLKAEQSLEGVFYTGFVLQ